MFAENNIYERSWPSKPRYIARIYGNETVMEPLEGFWGKRRAFRGSPFHAGNSMLS
jgi:hypothetical protein